MKKLVKIAKMLDKKMIGGIVVVVIAAIALTQVKTTTVYDVAEGGYGIQVPLIGWFVLGTMTYVIYKLQMRVVAKNEKREALKAKRAEAMRKAKDQSYMKKAENISIY